MTITKFKGIINKWDILVSGIAISTGIGFAIIVPLIYIFV